MLSFSCQLVQRDELYEWKLTRVGVDFTEFRLSYETRKLGKTEIPFELFFVVEIWPRAA